MQSNESSKSKKNALGILVYSILFLFLLIITNLTPFTAFFGNVLRILRPLIIGLVLAYLLNPFFRFFERKLFYKVRPHGFRRGLSLIFTYLVLFAVFAVLILLIVPQLADSILNFIDHSDEYLTKALDAANGIIAKLNEILPEKADGQSLISPLKLDNIKQSATDLLSSVKIDGNTWLALLNAETVGAVLDVFENILVLAGDVLLGFFISLYLLASKEKRYAQVMRWRQTYLSDRINNYITKVCTTADRSFGGFLRGKILDSTIIGILVFIFISVLKVPYAVLIAVIIGITDIVPIIGPFIGVIPSAVIILLTDPTKVIPFLLCILIIQQIDGNIIAPKILGENTGVSSLCVMISITTLGSLWGLVGMIMGVPLFATVLELAGEFLDNRLRKKGLSTATEDYYTAELAGEENSGDGSILAKLKKESNENQPAPEHSGSGALTEYEHRALATYHLARQHGLFSDPNEAALAAFAEDLNALDAVQVLEEPFEIQPEDENKEPIEQQTEETLAEQTASIASEAADIPTASDASDPKNV